MWVLTTVRKIRKKCNRWPAGLNQVANGLIRTPLFVSFDEVFPSSRAVADLTQHSEADAQAADKRSILRADRQSSAALTPLAPRSAAISLEPRSLNTNRGE